MDDFQACVRTRGLVRTAVEPDIIEKELDGADSDLETARRSLAEGNPKWAVVQCYYAAFHAAKALVLSSGFREKSHGCLLAALDELFVKQGALERKHADLLEDLMRLRWAADYRLEYPGEKGVRPFVEEAASFVALARQALKKR